MSVFFSFGLFFIGAVLTPLAILAAVFIYVRGQRGRPVDIAAGLTGYTVILLGASAVVLALGVAALLTSFMAEIDFDYTYGQDRGPFGFNPVTVGTNIQVDDERLDRDRARGLALILTGVAAGVVHLGLRRSLRERGYFDHGLEVAWDVLLTIGVGLVTLVLIGAVFAQTFERSVVGGAGPSPGGTIAAMWAFLGLWAVYAWRTLRHAGIPLFDGRRDVDEDTDGA